MCVWCCGGLLSSCGLVGPGVARASSRKACHGLWKHPKHSSAAYSITSGVSCQASGSVYACFFRPLCIVCWTNCSPVCIMPLRVASIRRTRPPAACRARARSEPAGCHVLERLTWHVRGRKVHDNTAHCKTRASSHDPPAYAVTITQSRTRSNYE